jgi:hypothetical protein
MNFGEAPSTDLLGSDSLCSVPKSVPSVFLKPILGTYGKDRKKKFGRCFGGGKRWEVQERHVLMEATNVSLKESRERVSGWEHKVVGQHCRKLIKLVLDDIVISR